MNCREVQELLMVGHKDATVIEHLAACALCAQHERLLALLNQLGPKPQISPGRLAQSLPHPPWLFRRPITYLPLFLGLGFLGVSVGLLIGRGGWPGGPEMATLFRAFSEASGYALWEAGLKVVSSLEGGFALPLIFLFSLGLATGLAFALWFRRIRA